MELGSLEVQIFVSLVVVLGTAFIALVCDFLKGNNEQLRERNVELRTRQDERERLGLGQPMAWLQGLASLVQRGSVPASAAPIQAEVPIQKASPPVPDIEADPRPNPAATPVNWAPPAPAPVSEPTPEPAMRRRLYDEVRPTTTNGGTWASKEELEQLAGRAARIRARHEASQQSAELPEQRPEKPVETTPGEPPSALASPEPVNPTTNRIHIMPPALSPESQDPVELAGLAPEVQPDPEVEIAGGADPVGEELTEVQPEPVAELDPTPLADLEASVEEQDAEPPPVLASEFSEAPVAQSAALPGGTQESAVLSRLLEENAVFGGVAVSIGINDFEALRERLAAVGDTGEAMAPVQKLIDSMLRPVDFACRFTDDEYVLLFPGESGSAAQRRLFQVSEKLWDFQLRSLGQLAVMFSWGGLEVSNDSLSTAVAAARERMYQTRRNRRQSPLDRKRVVNG